MTTSSFNYCITNSLNKWSVTMSHTWQVAGECRAIRVASCLRSNSGLKDCRLKTCACLLTACLLTGGVCACGTRVHDGLWTYGQLHCASGNPIKRCPIEAPRCSWNIVKNIRGFGAVRETIRLQVNKHRRSNYYLLCYSQFVRKFLKYILWGKVLAIFMNYDTKKFEIQGGISWRMRDLPTG